MKENEYQRSPSQFSLPKIAGAIGFLLFAWYTDILALQIPLFAYFICPILFVLIALFWLFKKPRMKVFLARLFLGFPVVLLVASVFSIVLSQAHDQWLMKQVRAWGVELRNGKAVAGTYPKSATRTLHGYGATFINSGKPNDPPVIVFDKFDQMRQSYLVPEDRFLEETES